MRNVVPAILVVLISALIVAGFIYLIIDPSDNAVPADTQQQPGSTAPAEKSPVADAEAIEPVSEQTGLAADPSQRRVFILSLDGLADWILDDMIERGLMPNTARILAQGTRASHAFTTIPAKTAVGHSSIWTSSTATWNGIIANSSMPEPYDRHVCTHTQSGFLSDGLRAEPIWVTAARQDRRSIVVQATQNFPFSVYEKDGRYPAPPENLKIFDGYAVRMLYPKAFTEATHTLVLATGWQNLPASDEPHYEIVERLGTSGDHLYYLIYDSPDVDVNGYDTVAISTSRDGKAVIDRIHPAAASPQNLENWSEPARISVDGTFGYAHFRLFKLNPFGSEFVIYRAPVFNYRSTDAAALQIQENNGGFVGNDGGYEYGNGAFGTPLPSGGDGSAERAYMETQAHVLRQMHRNMQVAMQDTDWNLMIGYQPIPDSQNHAWIGLLAKTIGKEGFDDSSPLWPYFVESYTLIDQFVGELYDSLPEGTIFVLVSDHGFTSVDTWFYPNVVLREAGLLSTDFNGRIDPARSQVVYYPGGGDFLFVNQQGVFKDGIVPADEAEDVLQRARQALLSARGPDGRPIVKEILEEDEHGLHLDGPLGGHLYFQLNPGYYNSSAADKEVYAEPMDYPRGMHFGDPRIRPMHSICSFTVKGSTVDFELGEMPSVDIAPTICAILGINPPAGSLGAVRQEVVDAIEDVVE